MRNPNVKATTMLLEGLLESSESMFSVPDNAWKLRLGYRNREERRVIT